MSKVLSIEKNDAETIVYNLEVAEDESYVANSLVVHNCRCRYVRVNPTFFAMGEDGKLRERTAEEIIAEKVGGTVNE